MSSEASAVTARWLWHVTLWLTAVVLLISVAAVVLIAKSDDPEQTAQFAGSGLGLVNVLIVSVLAVLTKTAYEQTKVEVAVDPLDLMARLEQLEDVVYRNGHIPTEEDNG